MMEMQLDPKRTTTVALAVGICGLVGLLALARTRAADCSQPYGFDEFCSGEATRPLPESHYIPLIGPTPADMAHLAAGWVDAHEIVAVAVVSDIVYVGPAATSTPDPTEIAEHPDLLPEAPVTYTLFSLKVERTLLDDGTIAAGEPLVIARQGPPDFEGLSVPMERVGDRYLYFLLEVSDFPETYAFDWAEYGRLLIDGAEVKSSGFSPEPVEFARHTPPAQFIDALATEIAVQYPTPTSFGNH